MQKPIVVVGSLSMDLVLRAERAPEAGETLIGSSFAMHSGGKGANQAVGVARLGYPAVMVGCVGEDDFGKTLRAKLQSEGLDVDSLETVDAPTGVALILVDDQGENRIVIAPGSNHLLTPLLLAAKSEMLAGAAMVLVQLEIPLETVEWLTEFCAKVNVPLMLDPAPARALPEKLLRAATWITPNETEAEMLTRGLKDANAQAAFLQKAGSRNTVLKQGAGGASFSVDGGALVHVATPKVETRDTTAAGDAFNAAFAVALCRGMEVEDAVRFATKAAAISVTRDGAQPSLATQAEVEAWS